MPRVLKALIGVVALFAADDFAFAADKPIDAARLVIKRSSSGKEKLVFTSTDPSALFPAIGSGDDPVTGTPGGVSITLVSDVEGIGTLTVGDAVSDPGWISRPGTVASYRYDNAEAPAGPSAVRKIIWKDGHLFKIVARSTALPLASVHGGIGVRIETGSLRNCAMFVGSSAIANASGRFIGVNAVAASLEDCSDGALGSPPVCGDGELEPGEGCEQDSDCATGSSCSSSCTCVPVASCHNGLLDAGEECDANADCATGEACSSSCTCMDALCPDTIEWTIHAGTGVSSTVTELDLGSAGIMHDIDYLDGVPLALRLSSSAGAAPACGESVIAGVGPSAGNCRCATDNRAICDEPFLPDEDDCAGAQCVCYLQPPQSISAGNTPACMVSKLSQDASGTWNVDTGAGEIALVTRGLLYLGEQLNVPCPSCDGDVTPNDGVRDGTCTFGENSGEACDANATDATFPAPGGGSYSYDCMPSSGKNVSGAGLALTAAYTTGTSALPPAQIPCWFGDSALCPCALCSSDVSLPCTSNADCEPAAGVCQKHSNDEPQPNTCTGGTCVDVGGGEGQCDPAIVEQGCDGMTRANGEPFINCFTNDDCSENNIGLPAGNCTLSENRECFLDPVTATGTASQTEPVIVASFCTSLTSKASLNGPVFGFPGPVRSKIAASTVFRCAGNHAATYPGCP